MPRLGHRIWTSAVVRFAEITCFSSKSVRPFAVRTAHPSRERRAPNHNAAVWVMHMISGFLEHHPWGLAAFSATTSVDECNASFTELRQCAPRGSLPAPNPAAPTPRRWGPRGARKWSNRGPALALLRSSVFRVSARTGLFCGVSPPTLCWRAEGLWRHDRRAYQRHVCEMLRNVHFQNMDARIPRAWMGAVGLQFERLVGTQASI